MMVILKITDKKYLKNNGQKYLKNNGEKIIEKQLSTTDGSGQTDGRTDRQNNSVFSHIWENALKRPQISETKARFHFQLIKMYTWTQDDFSSCKLLVYI